MSPAKKGLVVVGALAALALTLFLWNPYPNGEGKQAKNIRAAFDAEFLARPDGYPGLSKTYQFKFKQPPRQMDPGLMYKACADKATDVICAFATDGRIDAYKLKTLQDDRNFFPPYHAAPLVRTQCLRQHPEIKSALQALANAIDDQTMRELNYQVDEKGARAKDVAIDFLVKHKLIDPNAPKGSGQAGTIRVGGKHFTEQEILGELIAALIEAKTDLKVDKKLNLGGTMVCFNALKAGDLDLYPEYTGTGLVNILDEKVQRNPDKILDTVRKQFREKFQLTWLQPFGFNNTYTLTMRRSHADQLQLESISDLADHVNAKHKNNTATQKK